MSLNPDLKRLVSATLSVIACFTVAACGGGGGESGSTAQPALTTVAAMQATPALAVTAPTDETAASDPGTALARAMAQSSDLVVAIEPPAANPQPSPSMAQALSVLSHTEAATSPSSTATPTAAATRVGAAVTAAGITYYVDSKTGSDTNNGQSAVTGGSGVGPWRSLAKLAAATLLPGDTVRLTCGSVWKETLRLAASGTATSPITVGSNPVACATSPAIDGSTSIAASAWTLHSGNIYKAPLAAAPLQVFNSTGVMTLAHHPTAGFDAALPQSVYLRNAVTSDSISVSGRTASTYVTGGSDLLLPAGTTVTAGTKVRIRTLSWLMDERSISAVSGNRFTLDSPTTYRVEAGWGYFLLGQRWMLDSPGEWHYDSAAKLLYAWMPDSRAPATAAEATQLATGVDLAGRAYVSLDNIAVRKVSTGIDMRNSTGITLRGSRIEDTIEHGIYAAASTGASLSGSTFLRTGTDAISGHEDNTAAANGMQVLNNTLTDIGVVMSGETMRSLPARSRAAVRPGNGALVENNTLTNTGYIGIWAGSASTVRNNTVSGACSVLDDCGAIYTSGKLNNSVISGNVVQNARGAVAGKPSALAYTQAQGIYLDESASGVTVAGNTIVNTDNGLHLHVAANNTIRDNKLYGNRVSQMWLQENANRNNLAGDIYGNVVNGNQIVMTSATARGLYLESTITDTLHFGTFDYNRYLDSIFPTIAEERSLSVRTPYTLTTWRAAVSNGVSRQLDVNGSGTSQTRYASVLTNGSNVVPNGNMANDATGWAKWNATAPYGSLTRESCVAGWCARYVAGGSPGIVSSPNFSTVAGTWYRMTVDAAGGADGQLLNIVVRRGGGGTNGYESLSDRSLNVVAYRNMRRFSVIFKATKTINAGDPITRDLGARVDIQNVNPGQSVSVANLELVPIVQPDTFTRSDILLNAGTSAVQATCPVAASQPAQCANYVRLADDQPVTWPYYLAARSSEIVYTRDARLIDTDGDGIPDQQDTCAVTPMTASVNSRGCALGQ